MYHSLPRPYLYAAYRLQATFDDPGAKPKPFAGTCFFVTDGTEVFLVTNRHCIDAAYADPKYRSLTLLRLEVAGYFMDRADRASMSWDTTASAFQLPSNEWEDVAVTSMAGVNVDVAPDGVVEPYAFELGMVASANELGHLHLCDMLAFPGYPEWYDRNGDRPIIRAGTVASDPQSDYRSGTQPVARRIAFEAFSFDGSSGSPVIALEKGFKTDGVISGMYHRRALLIGISAGHLEVTGERDRNQQHHHSGISYMYKSTVISDLIKRARKA